MHLCMHPCTNSYFVQPEPSRPLNDSPAVKLALMDHESWVLLVGETFALGLLVEERLRHHATESTADGQQVGGKKITEML